MAIFRTGRHVGRTVYIQPTGPGDDDLLVGLFDTRELADFAVRAMNAAHEHGWVLPRIEEAGA